MDTDRWIINLEANREDRGTQTMYVGGCRVDVVSTVDGGEVVDRSWGGTEREDHACVKIKSG